jgi:adenylate cyclase
MGEPLSPDEWEREWRRHARALRIRRGVMQRLPADPRCKVCYAPFAGFGSRLVRPFGYRPSRKNPRMCSVCFEDTPDGGMEIDGGVLFADVRGFTTLSETMPPAELAELLNRFYKTATAVLIRHDAIIDKLVGDEVMGVFIPQFVDGDVYEHMVGAAADLLAGVGFGTDDEPWLPVGAGLDFGRIFVGNVGGGGEVRDFTALGDAVNTAARLQSAAGAGQIVVSERVYGGVAAAYPDAQPAELELKGKSAPVHARVIDVGSPVAAEAQP